MGTTTTNVLANLEWIGLDVTDVEGETIDSTEELIQCVAGSYRLFQKSCSYIILQDLRLFVEDETVQPKDPLTRWFPLGRRRFAWVKYANYSELIIPRLKLTVYIIAILVMIGMSVLAFCGWLLFAQTDLLIHAFMVKIALISMIFTAAGMLMALIAALGATALPAKTVQELVEKIIKKNLKTLLEDDRKRFKELLRRELP
jgi:hypothetical protein